MTWTRRCWILEHDVQDVFVRAVRTHDTFAPEARDLIHISMGLGGPCIADIEIAMATEYGYDIEATVVGQSGVAETIQPDVALVRYQDKKGFTFQHRLAGTLPDGVCSRTGELGKLAVRRAALRRRNVRGTDSVASLVADACIEALHSGQPIPVHTPAKARALRVRTGSGKTGSSRKSGVLHVKPLEDMVDLLSGGERRCWQLHIRARCMRRFRPRKLTTGTIRVRSKS